MRKIRNVPVQRSSEHLQSRLHLCPIHSANTKALVITQRNATPFLDIFGLNMSFTRN